MKTHLIFIKKIQGISYFRQGIVLSGLELEVTIRFWPVQPTNEPMEF